MIHNFKDTATISRTVVTGNKTTYEEVETIPCHIQPVSASYAQGQMGRDAKDFRLFSTGTVRLLLYFSGHWSTLRANPITWKT